jgi:hypothetical protein
MATHHIKINRAPVLTLWVFVVAERLGYKKEEALTLAKALTGLAAQRKGQALGIYHPSEESKTNAKAKEAKKAGEGKLFTVRFLGRELPAVRTKEGVRAASKGEPIKPESVEKYLQSKFGDALPEAREAMEELARSLPPKELSREAYALYGQFTPKVPAGAKGWGAKGEFDLAKVRELTNETR